MDRNTPRPQAGFSLVELLVAMVVTLVVSGAIYGLLAGGQNAFRREPELADRQQNIRVAMDLLKADVAAAGAGMAPFVQAFTDGLNGQGGAASSTQTAGSSGQQTDILELLKPDGQCPTLQLAAASGAVTGPLVSNEMLPSCVPDNTQGNQFLYVGSNDPSLRNTYGIVLGRANVPVGTIGFNVILQAPTTANLNPIGPNPEAGFCQASGGISPTCRTLVPAEVVRYQIDRDPADPSVPCLWRSRTGGFDSNGAPVARPVTGTTVNGNWQMVARGIEDLQVRYMDGTETWIDNPGAIYCDAPCGPAAADLARVVRRVEITISARALAPRLEGATAADAGSGAGDAVRGQLVTVVTPRAALQALSSIAAPPWH
jgi:type IV pilus assembly protein PilW